MHAGPVGCVAGCRPLGVAGIPVAWFALTRQDGFVSHHGNADLMTGALRDAESASWSVRASAGRRLAAWADRDELGPVLERLLLDAHDTAVTQETACALLERKDLYGLRAVLSALARAEESWTTDELAAVIDTDPRWMADVEETAELVAQLVSLSSDEDTATRNEALRLLRRVRDRAGQSGSDVKRPPRR